MYISSYVSLHFQIKCVSEHITACITPDYKLHPFVLLYF